MLISPGAKIFSTKNSFRNSSVLNMAIFDLKLSKIAEF